MKKSGYVCIIHDLLSDKEMLVSSIKSESADDALNSFMVTHNVGVKSFYTQGVHIDRFCMNGRMVDISIRPSPSSYSPA